MRALICMALLGLATSGCEKEVVEAAPLIRPVRYVVLTNDSGSRHRTFSGTIRAGNRTRLSFQVPGRVQKLNVKVGDKLRANQVVAKLDPADFDIQLREAQASEAQAQAQKRSAQANYDRIRALYENQNASRQDLDNARANRDTSGSAANAARQAVNRLQRQLQYATLTAPAAGTISQVEVEANEVVSAGQVLAVLQVGEQLEVAVEVPESTINQIRRGEHATVMVAAVNKEIEGEVYEVGVPGSGAAVFPITVRLEADPKQRVRAGMAAEVTFDLERDPDTEERRVVPATAVGEDRDGRFVFIVEPTGNGLGIVHRTPVTLGNLVGENIELLSGVKDGERVVTAGVSRIREGLQVKVPPLPTEQQALPGPDDVESATAEVAPDPGAQPASAEDAPAP